MLKGTYMKKTNKYRILILYAEVMEYLLTGINQFKKDFPESEILLFELDNKKLTNFQFYTDNFHYKKKSEYNNYKDFLSVCESFNPSLVLVSGRMDRHYLRVSRSMKKKGIYTVTLQDTQYNISIRQSIIRTFSLVIYKRYFCGFWGAGSLQTAFGLSLGFSSDNIFEGVYTANTNVFKYQKSYKKSDEIGKTIVYVGRFAEEKNFKLLISLFIKLNKEFKNIHKLILIGGQESFEYGDQIKSYPFMSSKELIEYTKDADIFCLPSKNEPWGVVIHEFSLLGFPLLLSNRCGANTKFLINGFNGYSFDPYDSKDFERNLKKMLNLNSDDLQQCGIRSNQLGSKHSPQVWAATLYSILLKAEDNRL